jgi:hypothetical protein
MTINLSESFNHVIRNARAILVYAMMQLTFYKCNDYRVKWRYKASDVIQNGVL